MLEVFVVVVLSFLIGYFFNLMLARPTPAKQPIRPPRRE